MPLVNTISPRGKGKSRRKYTDIWSRLKEKGYCQVECSRADTLTIINGVKKEKYEDKHKPAKKLLDCTPTEDGVIFKLLTDNTINNL